MRQLDRLPIPEPRPADINERADDILARAEFNEPEPLLDRLGAWIDRAMSAILDRLTEGGVGSAVGWLLLSVLIGALVYVALQFRRPPRRSRQGVTALVVDASGPAATGFQTAAEWRAAAETYEKEGRFDEAVRARYRATLAELIDDGLLEDLPGRTAGEYRRDLVDAAPSAAAPFGELTDRFEGVWYGPFHADAADVRAAGDLERRVAAETRT